MAEILFNLSNLLVIPFWVLMIFLPRWHWTQRIAGSLWPPVVLAVFYAALLLPQAGSVAASLANPTLEGLAGLLSTPQGTALGWIHFLAFDLFVGRWIYLDSQGRKISTWLVGPALFFTFMAGPVGLLVYLVVRWLNGIRYQALKGS